MTTGLFTRGRLGQRAPARQPGTIPAVGSPRMGKPGRTAGQSAAPVGALTEKEKDQRTSLVSGR